MLITFLLIKHKNNWRNDPKLGLLSQLNGQETSNPIRLLLLLSGCQINSRGINKKGFLLNHNFKIASSTLLIYVPLVAPPTHKIDLADLLYRRGSLHRASQTPDSSRHSWARSAGCGDWGGRGVSVQTWRASSCSSRPTAFPAASLSTWTSSSGTCWR